MAVPLGSECGVGGSPRHLSVSPRGRAPGARSGGLAPITHVPVVVPYRLEAREFSRGHCMPRVGVGVGVGVGVQFLQGLSGQRRKAVALEAETIQL